MEELLEIITWKQLGLYLNPIVILNTNGFFDPLLEMLENAIEGNFMRKQHGDIWHVAHTPEEAVELVYSIPVWDGSIRKFACYMIFVQDSLGAQEADTVQHVISAAGAPQDTLGSRVDYRR